MVRCENKPTWIATEKKPDAGGQVGSMSLCDDCLEVMVNQEVPATIKRIKEAT